MQSSMLDQMANGAAYAQCLVALTLVKTREAGLQEHHFEGLHIKTGSKDNLTDQIAKAISIANQYIARGWEPSDKLTPDQLATLREWGLITQEEMIG